MSQLLNDISRCSSVTCLLKYTCARFMDRPEGRYPLSAYKPISRLDEECKHFIEYNPKAK